eukprot:gene33264-42738_t
MNHEDSQGNASSKKPEWAPYRSSFFVDVEKHSGKARISWPGALVLFFGGIVGIIASLIGLALVGLLFWALIFG